MSQGSGRRAPAKKRWPWQRMAPRTQATRRAPVVQAAPSRPGVFFYWLKVTSVTLVTTCASLYAGYHGYYAAMELGDQFPIRTVRAYGQLHHIKPEHMRATFAESLRENFFEVDLQETRERIEAQPWIQRAALRKEWPDTLIVQLTERVPMALWGQDHVLGSDLAIFGRGEVTTLPVLPQLNGVDRDAPLVWSRFQKLSGILSPVSLNLKELVMAERYSWKLVLDNGMEIVVDENQWREKMDRFIEFYKKVPEEERALLARADLRYDNALAVKWKKKDDHPSAA